MKINKITIHKLDVPMDQIHLFTDLPTAFPDLWPKNEIVLSFYTDKGLAKKYVKENFPEVTDVKVIDLRTPKLSRKGERDLKRFESRLKGKV